MSLPEIRLQYHLGGRKNEIGEDMFGVVLWSDPVQNRAVIWCEDHGDLAFLDGKRETAATLPEMVPGDLVQFDVRQEEHIRLAMNPKMVASDEYPTLANDLQQARSGTLTNGTPKRRKSTHVPVQNPDPKILTFARPVPPANRAGTQARKAI